MIRSTVNLVIALLLLSSCVFASGFQTAGIGTKARGMGGAFRAVADDWTAAYYNPAGYAFLADNQLGFSQGFSQSRLELTPTYNRSQGGSSYNFGVYDELLYNHHQILSMPSGGFAVKLPLFGETVWGLSGFQPFDNNITWTVWEPDAAFNNTIGTNIPTDQIKTDIDVVAFQMTVAKSFSEDRLAIGLGFQLLKASIWTRDFIARANPEWNDRPKDYIAEFTNNQGDAWGFGLNFGLMYKINEQFNVAFTATLPTEFDIEGTSEQLYVMPSANFADTTLFLGGTPLAPLAIGSDFKTTLKLPGVFGLGLAYQPNEKLTIALDAEYTLWSNYEGLAYDYSNFDFTQAKSDSSSFDFFSQDVSNPAEWDNTGKLALGAHYAHNDVVSFMGGVSAEQSPLRNSLLFTPMFVETGTRYGFSGGMQLSFERWELGLITSFFQYPTDYDINWTVDSDNDGLDDSFPGLYSAAGVETILSVNYRF